MVVAEEHLGMAGVHSIGAAGDEGGVMLARGAGGHLGGDGRA